jgi:hypothetical protein
MLALLIGFALGTATIQVPVTGTVSPQAVTDLKAVPGIEEVATAPGGLTLTVADGREVRLRALERVLERHKAGAVATDRLAITPQTIFEINAGQCFFCAEEPLKLTLDRKTFIASWSVVDYHTKGRLRFRVEPKQPTELKVLGGDTFEDIVFTARYDGQPPLDLFWPTGGVLWRKDEATARAEATKSKKPLMIFPTAGT